jgi:hypothetical protein
MAELVLPDAEPEGCPDALPEGFWMGVVTEPGPAEEEPG